MAKASLLTSPTRFPTRQIKRMDSILTGSIILSARVSGYLPYLVGMLWVTASQCARGEFSDKLTRTAP